MYLRDNNIGVEGARKIAAALKENTTLTTLNLFNNNIGVDGAREIAEALKSNIMITNLAINDNYNAAAIESECELNGTIQRKLAELGTAVPPQLLSDVFKGSTSTPDTFIAAISALKGNIEAFNKIFTDNDNLALEYASYSAKEKLSKLEGKAIALSLMIYQYCKTQQTDLNTNLSNLTHDTVTKIAAEIENIKHAYNGNILETYYTDNLLPDTVPKPADNTKILLYVLGAICSTVIAGLLILYSASYSKDTHHAEAQGDAGSLDYAEAQADTDLPGGYAHTQADTDWPEDYAHTQADTDWPEDYARWQGNYAQD